MLHSAACFRLLHNGYRAKCRQNCPDCTHLVDEILHQRMHSIALWHNSHACSINLQPRLHINIIIIHSTHPIAYQHNYCLFHTFVCISIQSLCPVYCPQSFPCQHNRCLLGITYLHVNDSSTLRTAALVKLGYNLFAGSLRSDLTALTDRWSYCKCIDRGSIEQK